jgi:hypothetical protein
MFVYHYLEILRRTIMNKTVILLASLALLFVGCSDKNESGTSQGGESNVGEVIEEVDVTTESAEPAASDLAPETAGEEMGKTGDADDQGEETAKDADSTPGK